MKYLKQFTIILILSFIGEALHEILPFPVPGNIYGIVLLFFLLETKWIPLSEIEDTGNFLVEIMPVMFIPAAVGLVDVWDVIRPSWISYIVIIVISTFLVMIVAGRVTQAFMKKENEEKKEEKEHE